MLIIKVHPYLTTGRVRDYPEYLMRDWIARFSKCIDYNCPGTKIFFRDYRLTDMIVSESPEQIIEQIIAPDINPASPMESLQRGLSQAEARDFSKNPPDVDSDLRALSLPELKRMLWATEYATGPNSDGVQLLRRTIASKELIEPDHDPLID